MAAINSVITSALGRAIDGIFDLSTISRYFTTFDPTPQTYISLSSPLNLGTDYELEVYIASTSSGDIKIFGGIDFGFIVRLGNDGNVGLLIGNGTDAYPHTVFSSAQPSKDGKRHKLNFIVSSTSLGIFMDDVSIATQSVTNTHDSIIDKIGAFNTTPVGFFDGVMSDVKIWDGGDRDTGTLVLDMPIDGSGYGTDALVDNNQTVLGSELFDDVLQAGGGGTINTVDGTTTVTNGVGGFDYARNTNALATTTGVTYLATVNITGGTAVNKLMAMGTSVGASDLGINDRGNAGVLNIVFTATSTTTYVRVGCNDSSTGNTCIFDNISIKEIPAATPVGTAVNFVDADSEEFTFQDSGDWLAGEVVVNGGFDSDTGWTKGAGWTISGGKATHVTPNANSFLTSGSALTVGQKYLLGLTITDYTSGNVTLYLGGASWGDSMSSAGDYRDTVLKAEGVVVRINASSNSDFDGSIDNVSAKRILEAP